MGIWNILKVKVYFYHVNCKLLQEIILFFNYFQVAMAGDFILAVASMMIARLRSDDVTLVLSQVTTSLSHIKYYTNS